MAINPDKVVLRPFPAHLRRMKATDVPDAYGLNMVIFGVAGTGKTTLAASAQDSEYGRNVLFIDVEGGTRSISDRADIDVVKPANINEVKELYDWLVSGEHDYRTIVIDTLPELQRIGLKEIMALSKTPDVPQFAEWNKSTEQMARMVGAFRELSQGRGWNTIFIAHANEQKDDVTGAVLIRPNMTPAATKNLCRQVDVVGYLTRDNNGVRTLLMEPTRTIVAKYRQPLTGPQLPTLIQNPTLPEILAHMRGKAVITPVERDENAFSTDIVATNEAAE